MVKFYGELFKLQVLVWSHGPFESQMYIILLRENAQYATHGTFHKFSGHS